MDVIEDFDADLIESLEQLSAKHDFQIFEDRKFADIGTYFCVMREKNPKF